MSEAVFILLWIAVLFLAGISFYLPVRFVKQWEGRWKWVAPLPLVIPLFAIVDIIIGKIIDPASHPLFPFEIIISCFFSLAATGIVVLIRRYTR